MSCRVLLGGGETSFASLAEAVSAAIPNCEIIIDGVVEVSAGEGRGRTGWVVTAQQSRLESAATASASCGNGHAMMKFVSGSGRSAWSIPYQLTHFAPCGGREMLL